MYTRSYDNEGGIRIPEKYDGNAFIANEVKTDTESESTKSSESLRAPWDTPKPEEREEIIPTAANARSENIFSRYIKKLSFGALNIFGGEGGFHLGTEEILIIGVALFLFFSGGGDKECAIMLLLLLLVK